MTGSHAQRTVSGIAEPSGSFGADGFVELELHPVELDKTARRSPIVRDVGTVFSVQGFNEARHPLTLGPATLPALPDGTRISSLPLKFPGTNYRLPCELAALAPVIEHAVSFEHAINPDAGHYYCYLTVQQTTVEAGETQRGSAIHSDGVQGPRIKPKAPLERGYLTVDRVAPRFFVQPFDMTGVDPDRHLLDKVFESQARDEHAVRAGEGELVVFDSYCVHQALPASEPGPRAFLRLAFSTRQYDRLGNTLSACFADEYLREGWQFQPRPLPDLADPPLLESR